MGARFLFYRSKVFSAQMTIGEKYSTLNRIISINIKDVFERAKVDPEAQEMIRVREKATMDYTSDIKTAKD